MRHFTRGLASSFLLLAALSVGSTLAKPTAEDPTDNRTLARMLDRVVGDVEGEPGQWTFRYDGVDMMLVTDEEYDRVRIVAHVADGSELTSEHLKTLLEANFNRALDAKYALFRDNVWSVFVHPLTSLSKRQLISAVRQVAALRNTYGTTFSSSDD